MGALDDILKKQSAPSMADQAAKEGYNIPEETAAPAVQVPAQPAAAPVAPAANPVQAVTQTQAYNPADLADQAAKEGYPASPVSAPAPAAPAGTVVSPTAGAVSPEEAQRIADLSKAKGAALAPGMVNGDHLAGAPATQETPDYAKQAIAEHAIATGENPTGMSYTDMLNALYKAPTPEEVEQAKKKEQRTQLFSAIGDSISALANLYGTSKGAYNAYEPSTSMSAKTRAIWDKLKKDREAQQQYYTNMYMRARQLDEGNAKDERNYRLELQKLADANRRADNADARAERQLKMQEGNAKWEHEFKDKELAQRAKQIEASIEAQKSSLGLQWANYNLAKDKYIKELDKDYNTFTLGKGKGTVKIPKAALNNQTVGNLFNMLPEEVRATVHGKVSKGELGELIQQAPDADDMLIAIGANIEGNEDLQDALRQLSGAKEGNDGEKKKKNVEGF